MMLVSPAPSYDQSFRLGSDSEGPASQQRYAPVHAIVGKDETDARVRSFEAELNRRCSRMARDVRQPFLCDAEHNQLSLGVERRQI